MHTEPQYFFYGSVNYGPDQLPVQYGLFNAVDDRFVLVSSESRVLQWLSFLFSNRYNLSVHRLTTAENWHANIIDNLVCTRWSISDHQLLYFTRANTWNHIYDVTALVDCNHEIADGLLKKDIPYIMAAHKWITNCLIRLDHLQIGHILSSGLIELAWEDPMITMIKDVFNIISHETDFAQAMHKMKQYEQNNFLPVDLC